MNEHWEKASPPERFDIASDLLAVEESKAAPDFERIATLRALLHHLRVKCARADPLWDITHNLYMPDKGGRHTIFKPFPVQKELINLWAEHRRDGRPLRLLVPKSRRHGLSQVIAGLMYRHIRSVTNQYGLVLAHEDPAAKEIFNKYRYYHKHDPFAPTQERGSVQELKFAPPVGGQILVRTAGSSRAGVGHAFGFHLFHGSEAGLYEGVDPWALMSGVLTAMPPPPAWTAAVLESTGHGQQGPFYEWCLETWEDPHSSDWELKFFPWIERYDAWRNFCKHQTSFICECDENRGKAEEFIGRMDSELRAIHEHYNADAFQLNWWRWTYRNDIKAFSEPERRRKMRQEHPLDFMDCFQATGSSTFDPDQISLARKLCTEPMWQGNIEARTATMHGDRRVEITPAPKLRKTKSGWLSIWERPKAGHHYTIGIDLAQGAIKGDFHVMVVFDRTERKYVARFRTRGISPMRMIEPARLLSRLYSNAIICPEVNFFPQFCEILAETDRESFLYWRKDPTRTSAGTVYQKAYGWRTTMTTKRNLVTMLQDKLENEIGIFTDALLLHEMSIFKEELTDQHQVKYPGATGGDKNHDDVVIAASLALWADADMPLPSGEPEWKDEDKWGKPRTVAERMAAHLAFEEKKARMAEGEDLWSELEN